MAAAAILACLLAVHAVCAVPVAPVVEVEGAAAVPEVEIEGRQAYGVSQVGNSPGVGTNMYGGYASPGVGSMTATGGMTSNPSSPPVYNTTADISVLQYALTLENLEANFYVQALNNFTQAQFVAAGLTARDYNIITQVRDHEVTHVNALGAAIRNLGATPVPACVYNFPPVDVRGFLGIARALENTGVSAYDGAVGDISNPAYLSVAATIVTVEARHAAFFNYINGKSPASQPFDIPLGRRQIVTIASPFIASCPYTLPMTFPSLTIAPAAGATGTSFSVTTTANTANMFCAFIASASTFFAPVTGGRCVVPAGIVGDVYVIITSATTQNAINDASTIAGPAVFSVPTVGDSA